MASVSLSALQQAKSAMTTYASESKQVLNRLCQQVNDSVAHCSRSLQCALSQKEELLSIVVKQRQQAQDLQQEIERLTTEIQSLQVSIPPLEQQADGLDRQIMALNQRIAELQRQLAQAEDSDAKQRLQELMEDAQRELHMRIEQKRDVERRLNDTRQAISYKRGQWERSKGKRHELEMSLQKNEHQLRFLIDKWERLQSVYASVQTSAGAFVSAAEHLQSDDVITNSISCIDSCISSLDEYLGISQ